MFFEETISCKIQREDHKKIIGIVNLNQDKYENISHFVRVAALKLMREELKNGKDETI